MGAKKKVSAPQEKIALYQKLLASVPGVQGKSNFGAGYTAVNGNMYTMLSKHGVVGIRLPEAERAEFMERFGAELFRGDPAWPPAKEYVAVPDELVPKVRTLRPYLEASFEYVSSLKPKAAKKRTRPGS